MNKEFVPYEQALALKELGFDEPCLKMSEHKKICKEQEHPKGCQLHNLHCGYPDCTIDKSITPIGLPLYQQAFRWFREKHKLFAPVTTNGLGQYDFRIGLEWSGRIWDTYEEAELACLNKLIELVKKKQ